MSRIAPNLKANFREHRIEIALSFFLIFSASFFASYNASTAFSSDEVWSIHASEGNFSSVLSALKNDVHPPLYFILLHGWIQLSGTSERGARALSAVAYVITV